MYDGKRKSSFDGENGVDGTESPGKQDGLKKGHL